MKKKLLVLVIFLNVINTNGQNWTAINSPTTNTILSCSFVDENTGWIATTDAVYKTSDGGVSWVSQSLPPVPENTARLISSIHFINETTGIIAYGNYLYSGHDPSLVDSTLWTSDGGNTWEFRDQGNSEQGSYDLDAILVSPTIAYSMGQYGNNKKTTDGGYTWSSLEFNPSLGYSSVKIFALDPSNVYFAGLNNILITGAIGKEDNSVWNVTDFPEIRSVRDIFFIDSLNGWLVGTDGIIKYTNNGGSTWLNGDSGIEDTDGFDWLRRVHFINENEGWVISDTGKIITSTNGGLTWTVDYNGTIELVDMCYTSTNVGYVVGYEGLILKHVPQLSTEEPSELMTFDIYPNPSNDIVNIKLSNIEPMITSIKLFNTLGQMVKTIENISEDLITIKKHSLQNGIYFVALYANDTIIDSKKLIIN